MIRDLDLRGLDDAIGVVRARALLDAAAAEVLGQVAKGTTSGTGRTAAPPA